MTRLQKLLLVPCLSPLAVALVVAGFNLRQPTALRLLTWRSGSLPMGAWIALAAAGSALFTAGASLTAGTTDTPLRRQVHRPIGWDSDAEPSWRPDSEEWPRGANQSQATPSTNPSMVWPERDVRDPAPTVSVPFKVVKRGAGPSTATPSSGGSTVRSSSSGSSTAEAGKETKTASTPTTGLSTDDWDQPLPGGW